MKKKSLSVRKKKLNNLILKYLNNKNILKVFKEFKKAIDVRSKYAVAISGGPDSLALAYFCKCISTIYNTKIQYYLVDHKLRKESTKEANTVLQNLKKLKIKCKILTWKGQKPKSNIQSIARNKRYALLKNECKKNRIPFLLLGHHIDDLYENFLLRILRGSGLKGMVSMDRVAKNNIDNITIIRPLIDIKKSELKKISKLVFNFFIEDPSNNDENFKRIRIRNLINTLEFEGLDKNKLKLTIKNLKDSNNVINFYTKNNIDKNSFFFKEKNTFFLNKFFFENPREIIFRSFGDVIKKTSKKYYLPRGKSISSTISSIQSKKFKKTTLGGCIIQKIGETVVVFPERS
ncbi:MAG: tRNA lysidine(34) synthetase TilS [Pelagibacteraceae bacterium TMED268]|nr:MAG: tRNA lysidine(34) synthetase TilS [Pelagibacteraceae bacterium TMED268]